MQPEDNSSKQPEHPSAAIVESARVVGFGRADSRDDMERAQEQARELHRLKCILPKLTDDELSAFSADPKLAGSFLHGMGHPFSVLSKEMLARQFQEELSGRQHDRRQKRASWPAWVAALAGVATVGVMVWPDDPAGPVSGPSQATMQDSSPNASLQPVLTRDPRLTISPAGPAETKVAAPSAEVRTTTPGVTIHAAAPRPADVDAGTGTATSKPNDE